MKRRGACLSGTIAALLLTIPAYAQDEVEGEWEYKRYCAHCHGPEGTGNGEYAEFLRIPPSDLTALARKNQGVFPFDRVYRVIDGRQSVKAHGPRLMPVWGEELVNLFTHRYDKELAEELVRGRILALTQYLYLIQSK